MTDLELLAANAWSLMGHRNIILANEEWRNTPVDIDSGVTMGKLPQATIGAYLAFWLGEGCVECWQTSRAASQGVTVGSLGLVCRLLGNAGTGTNSCTVVWGEGTVTSECLPRFASLRRGYIEACKEYPVKRIENRKIEDSKFAEFISNLSSLLSPLSSLSKAWHEEEYGFLLTPIDLKDLGIAWAEARGWLDPQRPPVVRLQRDRKSGKVYSEMPTFTVDAVNPLPLCNTESLDPVDIDCMKRWIVKNYVTLRRYWEEKIDSPDLVNDLYGPVEQSELTEEDLRKNLHYIECEIKSMVGIDPFDFYMANHEDSVYEKINGLLSNRAECLNRLFRCTPENVKRIEQVNRTLLGLCNSLLRRVGRLYRSTISAHDETFDDDYEFEGELRVSVDFDKDGRDGQTDVLRLPDDDFYGSDFYYMAYVVQENEKRYRRIYSDIFSCRASWNRENPDPTASDEALGLVNELDDGQSWVHPFRLPEINHICICHAIHDMVHHHNWSWPDLLRINSYWADARAICQRITDQKGNRYKDITE